MPFRLAVIIPAYNEEASVSTAIDSAFAAGATEVIVSDGGSTDATVARSLEHGAEVISSDRLRARQMNLAAKQSSGDALLFLHADSYLPLDALEQVEQSLNQGYVFGGFAIRFIEDEARLRMVATMINLRTRWTRCPWGDQGQFLSREHFIRGGGFREMPIMEDYELAVRMKGQGKTIVVGSKISTSGRRFLRKGILMTSTMNWMIIAGYRMGVDSARLERFYRGPVSSTAILDSDRSEA